MITNDQITSLAREYAEEILNDESYLVLPTNLLNNLHQKTAEYAEHLIRFLLRRYCLVEKEKLKAIRFRNVYNAEDVRSKFTEECLIDALFPEIAKEVEG